MCVMVGCRGHPGPRNMLARKPGSLFPCRVTLQHTLATQVSPSEGVRFAGCFFSRPHKLDCLVRFMHRPEYHHMGTSLLGHCLHVASRTFDKCRKTGWNQQSPAPLSHRPCKYLAESMKVKSWGEGRRTGTWGQSPAWICERTHGSVLCNRGSPNRRTEVHSIVSSEDPLSTGEETVRPRERRRCA